MLGLKHDIDDKPTDGHFDEDSFRICITDILDVNTHTHTHKGMTNKYTFLTTVNSKVNKITKTKSMYCNLNVFTNCVREVRTLV